MYYTNTYGLNNRRSIKHLVSVIPQIRPVLFLVIMLIVLPQEAIVSVKSRMLQMPRILEEFYWCLGNYMLSD